MKKTHIVGEFSVIVSEANVGQVMDLMQSYLKTNDIDIADLDTAKLVERSETLFDIANLLKSLPLVEDLINSLVQITNKTSGEKCTYRDLAVSEVVQVLGHLKEVNAYFLEILGVVTTTPENQ